jgi:hypothetical protein
LSHNLCTLGNNRNALVTDSHAAERVHKIRAEDDSLFREAPDVLTMTRDAAPYVPGT